MRRGVLDSRSALQNHYTEEIPRGLRGGGKPGSLQPMIAPRIFRLCSVADWAAFRAAGRFTGSDADRRDGFIHFSAADQVAATAARHYAGPEPLVLVAVDAAALGDALKWEPSRGGALFPHLYAALPLADVVAWRAIDDRDFAFLARSPEPTEAEGWIFIR